MNWVRVKDHDPTRIVVVGRNQDAIPKFISVHGMHSEHRRTRLSRDARGYS